MAQLQREPKYTIVIVPSTERSWPFPDEVLLARDGTVLGILVDTNHLANHVIKRWTEIASPFRLRRQRSLGPTVNQTYNIEQICLTDYWQIVVRYLVDDTDSLVSDFVIRFVAEIKGQMARYIMYFNPQKERSHYLNLWFADLWVWIIWNSRSIVRLRQI